MASAGAGRVRALYKRLLLVHRLLPDDLRAIGDRYVREEFRRSKGVGAEEANRFLKEWEGSNIDKKKLNSRGELWGKWVLNQGILVQ
eukprot:g33753.t1